MLNESPHVCHKNQKDRFAALNSIDSLDGEFLSIPSILFMV